MLLSLALAGLVVFLYAPVRDFGFVSLDDPFYIQQNAQVQSGLTWDSVGWSFTHARMRNWHPLAWISHMIDVELFGDDAGGHHLMNVAIQAVNVILLLWVLRALTGSLWRSTAVAALFAAHPFRVESVAWVTERKDLLAGMFFLWTVLAYVRYARRPGGTNYSWVVLCFLLALLSKSTVVTLPAVLLLLDVWPLRRVDAAWARSAPNDRSAPSAGTYPLRSMVALVVEKLPLVLMSYGGAAAALWAAGESATNTTALPMANRVATPAIGLMEYLRRTFWPDGFACFYPMPQGYADGVLDDWVRRGAILHGVFGVVTVAVLVAAFGKRRKGYLALGWFWFIGMLFPALGFLQVGSQLIADRFIYLPHIGLFIAIVWGVADLLGHGRKGRVAGAVLALAVVTSLAAATRPQVQTWRNSFRLFDHAVRVTEDNYFAHDSLGVVYAKRGDTQAAQEHLREALRIHPTFVSAYLSLADVLIATSAGDRDGATPGSPEWREAEQLLRTAMRIDPGSFGAHFQLGKLMVRSDRFEPAMVSLRQALECRPGSVECAALLGQLEVEHGDLGTGIELLKGVVERRPEDVPSRQALRNARRLRRDR